MINPEFTCMNCMMQLNEPKGICPHCGFHNASCANAPHQLECGSILAGSYMVGRVLGQGGFGITYVGLDLNLNLKVAIKEYFPKHLVYRDLSSRKLVKPLSLEVEAIFYTEREKFLDEAKVLAHFSSEPGIVNVYKAFFENETAYFVMEYIDGETLGEYAVRCGNQNKLSSVELLSMMKPLFNALALVHEANVLHRDISPDNIMRRKNGMLILVDFGAARQCSPLGEHKNTVILKPRYAPEEQYNPYGEQGPWTDVYALCATIYHLTTAQLVPSPQERSSGVLLASPNTLGANFSPAQEAAILHGLALKVSDRTKSIGQLQKELASIESKESKKTSIINIPLSREESDVPEREPFQSKLKKEGQLNRRRSSKLNKKQFKNLIIGLVSVVVFSIIVIIFGFLFSKEKVQPQNSPTLPIQTDVKKQGYHFRVGQVYDGLLAAGSHYSAVLNSDGTVSAYGGSSSMIIADNWSDIVQLSGYGDLLAGLRSDGTVIVSGADVQYLNVDTYKGWTDIVQVEVSYHGLLALTRDGYVLYTGNINTGEQDYGRSDCVDWYSVKKLIKGDEHIVAVNADGTMNSAGMNNVNQCAVSGFSDVIDAATGCQCTYILHANGTVKVVGGNPKYDFGQFDAADWTDIIAIECGDRFVIGLKSDGTVVAAGDNEYGQKNVRTWTNIVAIYAGKRNAYALDVNGKLYSTDYNSGGQKDIDGTFIY